jgi:colanic acid/amylovoran biosynthesis glycosyltransferase
MKNIAIISPFNNAYSETFIKAHKEKLSGCIFFLHGGFYPNLYGDDDIPISSFLPKSKSSIIEKLLKTTPYIFFIRLKDHFFSVKIYTNEEILANFLKVKRIDIVLAEYGPSGCEVLESCKISNTKLIVHFHGFDASDTSILGRYERKYKEMFEYASYVIVVSNIMKEKIKNMGCPESKIILNTYGPNDQFLNITPSFSNKQFIAVGRFVDKKAPYYTIFAFQKVLKKHPDSKLIIAGDGELLNTCKNIVRMLNLSDRIIFPGIISPNEFQEFLRESIAFVQHYITADSGDMEGTPVAVLEASAAGIPVISTKHAGIPDVIINEDTGLLVEEHDVEGMAKNMIRVLDDLEFAKKLGLAGRKRIKEQFSMGKHISIIQNLIDLG